MDSIVNDRSGLNINVFTLNCWGLKWPFAKHRDQRIKAIAQHLLDNDYDVIFLQEVWSQKDFNYLRTKTENKYSFAHFYRNASVIGSSGLALFSKWTPEAVHFEPYVVNGSPFYFWHGDWFSGKGVGYAKVSLPETTIHFFCTHMHAQYDDEEQNHHQYFVHRLCQSYQLAKFINMISASTEIPRSRSNLIVLAGDLNTSAKELPYQLLVTLTGLDDCFHARNVRLANLKNAIQDAIEDHEDEPEFITCGHQTNTYSTLPFAGKRIDFIMYKLKGPDVLTTPDEQPQLVSKVESVSKSAVGALHHNDTQTVGGGGDWQQGGHRRSLSLVANVVRNLIQEYHCVVDRIIDQAKDPITGLSFSDHQPVIAKLNIKTLQMAKKAIDRQMSCCSNDGLAEDESPQDSAPTLSGSVSPDSNGHYRNNEGKNIADLLNDDSGHGSVKSYAYDEDSNGSSGYQSKSNSSQNNGSLASSVISNNGSNSSSTNGYPRCRNNAVTASEQDKNGVKVEPRGTTRKEPTCHVTPLQLIETSMDHIRAYHSVNPRRRLMCYLVFSTLALLLLTGVTIASLVHQLFTSSVVILGWILASIIVSVVIVIMEVSYQHEQNGIRAILQDFSLTHLQAMQGKSVPPLTMEYCG